MDARVDLPHVVSVMVDPFVEEFVDRDPPDRGMSSSPTEVVSRERADEREALFATLAKLAQEIRESAVAVPALPRQRLLIRYGEEGIFPSQHRADASCEITGIFLGEVAKDLFRAPLTRHRMVLQHLLRQSL